MTSNSIKKAQSLIHCIFTRNNQIPVSCVRKSVLASVKEVTQNSNIKVIATPSTQKELLWSVERAAQRNEPSVFIYSKPYKRNLPVKIANRHSSRAYSFVLDVRASGASAGPISNQLIHPDCKFVFIPYEMISMKYLHSYLF